MQNETKVYRSIKLVIQVNGAIINEIDYEDDQDTSINDIKGKTFCCEFVNF
jgi:hypothetical protein